MSTKTLGTLCTNWFSSFALRQEFDYLRLVIRINRFTPSPVQIPSCLRACLRDEAFVQFSFDLTTDAEQGSLKPRKRLWGKSAIIAALTGQLRAISFSTR